LTGSADKYDVSKWICIYHGRKEETSMRIDAIAQMQQVYGVGKTKRSTNAGKVSRGTDAVEISSIGKDIQTVKAAVKAAPDVRANKVADIKKQIEAGTYNVSGESFADKLLAKYNEAAGLS
jgi:negative regulator of flagellin synthesis FlgM